MTATADLGFAGNLAAHGDRLAAVAPDGTGISYRELDLRVSTVAERLGPVRRLVLLAADNDLDSLVCYLAALRGGHPVLPAAPDRLAVLTAAYDPDVVIGEEWDERRLGTAHELHPELALLLSTSGTTGSPKLVRLSADSLRANALAIASFLDIRDTDRAMVSLPMHYCYGLSVVNSNLQRGAGLVLTNASVVDAGFWAAVREHGVTSLHGVPHTFELFDRAGFERMELPSLRYVTQAGGRLDPAKVRRFAELGERRGWRLFVMYGQTEATARMAYLPPELAREHPGAIGVPIPGGTLDLDDGELVYRGPNVMLGYATGPDDLALGRTVHELRTGDLARRTPAGLYEVIGRKSRFLKLFGLRVDLDQVERALAVAGFEAACAGDDDVLVVAVRGAEAGAAELVSARSGLPAACVRVRRVTEFPRLPNGKLDYAALAAPGPGPSPEEPAAGSVRAVFAGVLGLARVPGEATFAELGGDSLSYVRTSVALERVVGRLPPDWPAMTVADLERLRASPSRMPAAETSIVLRALAIVLVVGSHVGLFDLPGGAHLLLVVAGWNFARFLLPGSPRRMVRVAALIAVPTVLWLVYRLPVTDDVNVMNVLLVNNFVRTGAVGYWFVEVLVHALLVLAVVFAVPAVRRFERANGYLTALLALGVTLLPLLGFDQATPFFERNMTTLGALWFVALGWLAQRSDTVARKAVVLAAAVALVPGTLDSAARGTIVLTGVVMLLWIPGIPLPRPAIGLVSLVAGASLYIYLTHYAVFPVLLAHLPAAPVVALSVVAGVLTWQATRLGGRVCAALGRCRRRTGTGQDDGRCRRTSS